MSEIFPDFIAYGRLPYYPHMGAADAVIWERYLAAYPKEFDAVVYDVAIGAGAEFDVTDGGQLGAGIKRLYQRKIDVVGKKGSTIWLIELKPRAATGALGQLQGYERLFKRDFTQFTDVKLRIITDILMPEMEFLAQGSGIELVVV